MRAGMLFEESLPLFRAIDTKGDLVAVLLWLGRVALNEGDNVKARIRYEEALSLAREIENKLLYPAGLVGFGIVAWKQNQRIRAATLLGAAEAHLERTDRFRSEFDLDILLAEVHAEKERFAAAWAEGQAMTLDQAVAYALDQSG